MRTKTTRSAKSNGLKEQESPLNLSHSRFVTASCLPTCLGLIAIALLVGFLPSVAKAEPLELQVSALKFKPKLWLSSEYDDNVFFEADREPTGNLPNAGALLRFGLGLGVDQRRVGPVKFSLESSAAYRQYIYLEDNSGRGEAEIDKLRQGRNGIDHARFNTTLLIGTMSDIQFILSDRFSYVERPAYESTVFGFERVDNRLGAALDFAPGRRAGGGPLGFKIGYELRNVFFLNDGAGLLIQNRSEKQGHTISLDSRWRFLPKNFLTLDISYTANDYNDFEQGMDGESAEELSRDSSPLRAELGLTGLITPRFSVFLKGGYSNTFNDNGPSFEGFVGLFQLSYIYDPVFEINVGYQRDGQDSGFSNFYTLDRVFVKGALRLSTSFSITANLSYDQYEYNETNAIDDTGRVDPVVRGQLAIKTYLPSHFALQLAYSIEGNYTDYELPVDDPTDFAAYQRQLFTLSLFFN